MLTASVRLKDPKRAERDLNRLFISIVNKGIRASVKPIQESIRIITSRLLRKSFFAHALFHGNLAGHLGIPAGQEAPRLYAVIDKFVNSIQVSYVPLKLSGNNITNGVLTIGLGKTDFEDLIKMPDALIITNKFDVLNWVEWTLVKGDTIVILGYDVKFGQGLGRSGQAIMIELGNRSWRVPPPFDGVPEDNWITREIENGLDEYVSVIETIVNIEIKKAAT